MSLVVETNLQKKRGKNKQHLLFLHHREAQRQKKKGTKEDSNIIVLFSTTDSQHKLYSLLLHIFILL